ncbi:YceI family protein [Luteitalea sp.]
MTLSVLRPTLSGAIAITALLVSGLASAQESPVVVSSATVTVSGTSTVLDWSATTNEAQTRNVKVTSDLPGGDFFWVGVIQPGAVESFEVVVPVAALKSDRDNFTADMHVALKADVHPDIVFTMQRMEKKPGGARAIGLLKVAGVEKEVTLNLITSLRNGKLLVMGKIDLLMTDFGITPPTAMMGVLKTDPKVTVKFETWLAKPTT